METFTLKARITILAECIGLVWGGRVLWPNISFNRVVYYPAWKQTHHSLNLNLNNRSIQISPKFPKKKSGIIINPSQSTYLTTNTTRVNYSPISLEIYCVVDHDWWFRFSSKCASNAFSLKGFWFESLLSFHFDDLDVILFIIVVDMVKGRLWSRNESVGWEPYSKTWKAQSSDAMICLLQHLNLNNALHNLKVPVSPLSS